MKRKGKGEETTLRSEGRHRAGLGVGEEKL